MREIKFRGFSKETNKWHLGCGGFLNEYTKESGYEDDFILFSISGPVTVVPESVGEFTYLRDKNDKDIYEGDIVRFDDNYMTDNPTQTGVVAFGDASFLIDSGYMKHYRWMDYECEVVGNIYENYELLEAAE